MPQSQHLNELPPADLKVVCDLIQSAKEECTILRASAVACSDTQLNELLIELSNERGCFAFELEGYVERHGINPEIKHSYSSPFRRAIQQLQVLLRKGDTKGVLKECEQHEKQMLEKYGKALRQAAPQDAWPILNRQYERVRYSRLRIRQWLDKTSSRPLPC